MSNTWRRTICWRHIGNGECDGIGFEHLLVADGAADGVVLAFDEELGPFRLMYRLAWDGSWRLRDAQLAAVTQCHSRSLSLRSDGGGHWEHSDGRIIHELDGCIDLDIWPTPFTNSFPIWRKPFAVGERQSFRMAWICAPDLTFCAKPQTYTRLSKQLYLFESVDGTGYSAELPVDQDGIVLDYPGLFQRVAVDDRTEE